METIKCPVCGREVQKGTRFCGWCGHTLTENMDERKHEWPEDEQSVSFTIYEATQAETEGEEEDGTISYAYDNAEGMDDYADQNGGASSTDGWTRKYVLLSFTILLVIGLTVALASLLLGHDESPESRMPDYEKVVQKRQLQNERREQRLEQQREEMRRHEEEVRRMEEQEKAEALEAERLREDEQALQGEVMSEEELDARIEQLLEGM